MREDPIVAEVRRIREELAARNGFDVAAIFAQIRKGQAALGRRLVKVPTKHKALRQLAGTGQKRRS